MDCVEAMRAVFATANTAHVGNRLEDWRKMDLKASAQLQQHVKELARINESMERFLDRSLTPDGIGSLRASLTALEQRSEELAEINKNLATCLERAAEKAASKVVYAWSKSVKEQAETNKNYIEEQRLQWCNNTINSTRLNDNMKGVQAALEKVEESLRQNNEQAAALMLASREAGERSRAHLETTVDRFERSSRSLAQSLAEQVREGFGTDIMGLGQRLDDLFSDTGKAGGLFVTMAESIRNLQEAAHDSVKDWRGRAAALDEEVISLRAIAETAKITEESLEVAQKETEELKQRVSQLSEELSVQIGDLEVARTVSMNYGLKRLKDVEKRGAITLDRGTGEFAVRTPVDFGPVKPGAKEDKPPEQAPLNPEVVDKLITDVIEVANIFEAPIMVEVQTLVGKGGTPGYWDALAKARGQYIQQALFDKGLQRSRVTLQCKALKGKATGGELAFRIDPALFPVVAAPATGKAGAKRK